MTLDEAIKHCEEKAEEQEYVSQIIVELHHEESEREHKTACDACAAEHRQLVEWLTELKELKAADVQPVSVINADVQPVDRWISVEDRLPEPEKEVLVWYRYTWGAGFTSYRFGISRWYSNIKRWYEGCLPKDIEVLYWRPLPEPPETKKG